MATTYTIKRDDKTEHLFELSLQRGLLMKKLAALSTDLDIVSTEIDVYSKKFWRDVPKILGIDAQNLRLKRESINKIVVVSLTDKEAGTEDVVRQLLTNNSSEDSTEE